MIDSPKKHCKKCKDLGVFSMPYGYRGPVQISICGNFIMHRPIDVKGRRWKYFSIEAIRNPYNYGLRKLICNKVLDIYLDNLGDLLGEFKSKVTLFLK
jgi:hypothetical protein